jgi:hypothetical protein
MTQSQGVAVYIVQNVLGYDKQFSGRLNPAEIVKHTTWKIHAHGRTMLDAS